MQYCTKVKYLDLGHNDELPSIDFARNMPELEVLIIAMTAVTDISPLESCPKLEYLELNSTNISDLSPLKNSTGLHHLNIACCPKITDISPLYGLTELERLWIGSQTPVPTEQVSTMKASVPGCTINTTAYDPHDGAWRYTGYADAIVEHRTKHIAYASVDVEKLAWKIHDYTEHEFAEFHPMVTEPGGNADMSDYIDVMLCKKDGKAFIEADIRRRAINIPLECQRGGLVLKITIQNSDGTSYHFKHRYPSRNFLPSKEANGMRQLKIKKTITKSSGKDIAKSYHPTKNRHPSKIL